MDSHDKLPLSVALTAVLGIVAIDSIRASSLADRVEALEARTPCQCVIQEHCDFTDVAPETGTGADEGRVEWERWERVDGRASK